MSKQKIDTSKTVWLLGEAKSDLMSALRAGQATAADLRKIEKIAEQIEALQAKLTAKS